MLKEICNNQNQRNLGSDIQTMNYLVSLDVGNSVNTQFYSNTHQCHRHTHTHVITHTLEAFITL